MSHLEKLPDSMDTIEEDLRPETLIKLEDVLTMSAKNCVNTSQVMERVRTLLDDYADKQLAEQQKDRAVMLCDDDQQGVLQKHREHARRKLV